MASFGDCRQRINRAKFHRDSLIESWKVLLKKEAYSFVPHYKGNRTGSIRVVHRETLNNDLPLELGEFFYQLRAALDGSVFAAACILHSTDSPPGEGALQVPICSTQAEFTKQSFRIEPLSQELKTWINTVQPYNSAATEGKKWGFINDSLRILNDCARKDRHRFLHVVGAVIATHTSEVTVTPPAWIVSVKHIEANILENESDIIEIVFDGADTTGVNVEGDLAVDVSIKELPGIAGFQLGALLHNLILAVDIVVGGFEEILKSKG